MVDGQDLFRSNERRSSNWDSVKTATGRQVRDARESKNTTNGRTTSLVQFPQTLTGIGDDRPDVNDAGVPAHEKLRISRFLPAFRNLG